MITSAAAAFVLDDFVSNGGLNEHVWAVAHLLALLFHDLNSQVHKRLFYIRTGLG
jgi:hypothetical protein